MTEKRENYIPALRFDWLTKFYDPVVELTTREKYFKKRLIEQADLKDTYEVIDVGSGTGTLAILIKNLYPNIEVNGLDGDSNILEIANRKSINTDVKVDFRKGLSYDMPYKNEKFDRCFSSLFFHHLTLENKENTFREMHRILKSEGEIHIADWGKPTNRLMRILFYLVQIFDGFETTTDNVKGVLPQLMKKAGFHDVSIVEEVSTIFGTMTLYKATKSVHSS